MQVLQAAVKGSRLLMIRKELFVKRLFVVDEHGV
jgi:hypothetical protein